MANLRLNKAIHVETASPTGKHIEMVGGTGRRPVLRRETNWVGMAGYWRGRASPDRELWLRGAAGLGLN